MANYLNRPSIFEIATAFEDGQEEEINKEKDGYKKPMEHSLRMKRVLCLDILALHMRLTTMPIKQKELEEN